MLPARAPAEVVERLNTELNKLLKQPDIRQRLSDMGAEVMGGTSSEFAKFTLSEIKRYEGIVKDSGAPKE
jgi:tripartite-type tricarboxylate transporter receptor subunit TctC